jgi:ferredoxin-NADP reductase
MTSLHLVLWIVGAILLQLAIYLAIGFARHWQDYRALRTAVSSGDGFVDPAPAAPGTTSAEPPVAAWRGLRSFRVVNRVAEDASRQVCSFYLAPQDGKPLEPFYPGQFLTFALDVPALGGGTEAIVRCYSLSDAPHPETYRVSIKRAPAPAGSGVAPGRSSNYFHDHVQVGSLLQVRAPAGHFYLDSRDAPVVLIAGGVGITPMLSMLNSSLAAQGDREVWLFYGVRDGAELVMLRHLQDMARTHVNFRLHLCFSAPKPDDLAGAMSAQEMHHHSRVDVALLRRLLPLKPFHYYLCGPTPMLQSLVPALEDWGVADNHIHFEAFGPASIPRKKAPTPQHSDGPAVVVTFSKSGKQVPWEPGSGSLLAFAEAHGISVQSGCRAGGCGSCQTTIVSGEVAYSQTPDCDPEPGNCLLCVCTPRTAVTLEA